MQIKIRILEATIVLKRRHSKRRRRMYHILSRNCLRIVLGTHLIKPYFKKKAVQECWFYPVVRGCNERKVEMATTRSADER